MLTYLKLIRVQQWVKNFLLFVPLLAAHQFSNHSALKELVITFFAFSFCASSVYIINDFFDAEHDRKHPLKSKRPLATGDVSTRTAFALVVLLLLISIILSLLVTNEFLAILLVYFLITCAYTVWLKKIAIVDCMTLAMLYTLRIIAGAVAVNIPLSFWLLTFSFFIFLSLANLKRYIDLQVHRDLGNLSLGGREYTQSDATLVKIMGISSGFNSSLVLALYLQGETVTALYSRPEYIWLTVPITLLWINRLWIKADRKQLQIDPLDYALKDIPSIVLGLSVILCFLFATNGISL